MYVQKDTLLLADMFKKSFNMSIEIYAVYPAHFLSESRLAWQAALKKTKGKLDLLTNMDMLLVVEKGIRGDICHVIH